MAGVQQVDHSLGGELEPDLHSKSHAESDQQQVLAQAVLFRPAVPSHQPELFGDVYVPERHADLHQEDEADEERLYEPLPRRDESRALGPPVALELGVHPAVDPVQQAVYVVAGHIPLLLLEKIRARWNV